MKFKMAEKSLFAILLRSPWWISLVIALGLGLAAAALLPPKYFFFGAMGGLPFLVITVIAGYRQFKAPSTAHVAGTLAQLATMSWRDFSSAMEQAYVRQGYEVARLDGAAADFVLSKSGGTTLLCCKRWKAARLGVEVLESLEAARAARKADGCLFVTLGEVSDKAREFAVDHRIGVMQGTDLAQFLRPVLAAK